MSAMASQITSLTIVYSTTYPGTDQRKYQSPASLAFVRKIHQSPVNSPHKGPVTRKMFPFDDVIMILHYGCYISSGLPHQYKVSYDKQASLSGKYNADYKYHQMVAVATWHEMPF